MSNLKVYDDSKNYTAVIVKLTNTFALQGLDNLVGVSVFGNTCIIPKTYDLSEEYVFFPSECVLSSEYIRINNLYRNSNLNEDQKSKGYFEENGRVKAIKLKGNKSTGIVMPMNSLRIMIGTPTKELKVGDEFNEIHDTFICKKYIVPIKSSGTSTPKQNKLLDEIVDSKMFPQHIDTEHLLKNLTRLNLEDNIVISIKLHGTSARIANTLTKRKLKWHERLAKKLGVQVVEEEYNYVAGSRKVVKSVAFGELKNKNHYYSEDLWTRIGKEVFENKLHKGEAIYYEIIGRDFNGGEIQGGYTYNFNKPSIFVYRITNINSNGIEVDLTWDHMRTRAKELGVDVVPTVYNGSLNTYLDKKGVAIYKGFWQDFLEEYLKKEFLDKPSMFDPSVIEEGICFRVETYPRPRTYKLKSPEFLIHEGKQADKEVVDVESQN